MAQTARKPMFSRVRRGNGTRAPLKSCPPGTVLGGRMAHAGGGMRARQDRHGFGVRKSA